MSKVAVIGAGYVGLTTAACLADLGNQVTVVDIDQEKIALLRRNQVPFYEPGIQELVERNAKARRLAFTTSYADAVPGAEYAIIAVSTPEGEGGEADLSYVEAAASSIADAMDGPLVVINKSTVPPLTGDMVSAVLKRRNSEFPAAVVSNPEFLREGSAIQDFMHPDRVVVGSHDRAAAEKVARLYAPLEAPILITPNIYTAEMVKYASNAFLATRISFINEIAMISERVGADAKLVAEGMGLDKRIGPLYLDVGIGWGGSCFPKDVAALTAFAEGFAYHPELLHAVMDINRDQRMLVIDKLRQCLDELPGCVIGLLGLSFKPNTDDMREAPSIDIAKVLLAAGAEGPAYYPAAGGRSRGLLPQGGDFWGAYPGAPRAGRPRLAAKPEASPGQSGLRVSPGRRQSRRLHRRRRSLRPALRIARFTSPVRRQPDSHAQGRHTRDDEHARPRAGEERHVSPGVDVRGLWGPAGPSAARGVLGQRESHRASRLLRRSQAVRRSICDGSPPVARSRYADRADLQHARSPDAGFRRSRGAQLHGPGDPWRGPDRLRRRIADPEHLLRLRPRPRRAGGARQERRAAGQPRQPGRGDRARAGRDDHQARRIEEPDRASRASG